VLANFEAVRVMGMPSGALLVIGLLMVFFNIIGKRRAK